MTSKKRSLGTTPLWLIALLGVAITALGVYIQATGTSPFSQMGAGTLAALGGGVIGAAISIYFAAGEGRDTLFAVRELLADSLRANMRSAETDLKAIRHHWHYYHLTQRDSRFLWRHTDYHFEQSNTTSSIVLMIKDVGFGREHLYRAEAAIRGNRMILIEAPDDGGEPPIIAVTPFFTEGYRKVRAGVVFLRSLDGEDMLTKCLWSATPLVDANGPDISDQDGLLLEEIWDRAFRPATRILPSLKDSSIVAPTQRSDIETN